MGTTLLTAILTICVLCTYGSDLTLEVQTPKVVSVGETFRISFIANGKIDNFSPPSIEGLRVIAGPAQSTSSSVNIVNGKVTQRVHVSLSYTVYAEKEGKFTIGAAKIKQGNNEAQTQPFVIESVGHNSNRSSQGAVESKNTANTETRNLFVDVTLSKREVYRGEYIVASTKLYARGIAIAGLENVKLPTFNGFWTQEIAVPQQVKFERENVKGAVYDAGILNKQLIFPQQVGELTIPACEIDIIEQVRTRSRDVFDDFFGGGVQNVRRHLVSSPKKIKVKELPSGAPRPFTGAVGNFKLSASLSKNELTANDATSLTIRISGSGNLKLINAPKVDLPVDFEIYDSKTTESIKNSNSGAEGHRQFELPIIPRSAGSFTIPPIEFSYFNPVTEKYVTLQTKAFDIEVKKDTKSVQQNYTSSESRRENLKVLGQDVRFIKSGATVKNEGELFFASGPFYLLYCFLVALFIAAYMWLSKQEKDNKDVVLIRNKKARKVAKKRLDASAHLLKTGNNQGFYDELLRAMWGYLGDKLSIPVAELSQEKVQTLLAQKQIEEAYIEMFIGVINECEFTRYAPTENGKQVMEHLYADAVDIISKLEQRIK
ncbi:MAG: BatD family protein [Bacteroidales bacterium]